MIAINSAQLTFGGKGVSSRPATTQTGPKSMTPQTPPQPRTIDNARRSGPGQVHRVDFVDQHGDKTGDYLEIIT